MIEVVWYILLFVWVHDTWKDGNCGVPGIAALLSLCEC
jgi:hypothetical protein